LKYCFCQVCLLILGMLERQWEPSDIASNGCLVIHSAKRAVELGQFHARSDSQKHQIHGSTGYFTANDMLKYSTTLPLDIYRKSTLS
jgi:hypothetical protein